MAEGEVEAKEAMAEGLVIEGGIQAEIFSGDEELEPGGEAMISLAEPNQKSVA